ncbi:MAG TPA: glucose-6-phosphate dehydrogenase assembly protein OpcA [Bryobacteraceae bacterium]|nr:glucose-6-phosphate dehydrogenase assembly protein OpcA [Bryobacteraceae bacterium]
MSTAVTPEGILKELTQLWRSLGESDENGVLRACAMTLIMAADEEEEAAALGEMIAEIMHAHPSRAIVLRIRNGNDPLLESNVFAQCWMPFGKRQQICCEQIELKASEGSLKDLPRLVHALMAPDLPVVLVCRSPHLFSSWAFQPLLAIAGTTIVDSRRSSTPASMLQHITNLRTVGHQIRDLAWTAVTRWRESVACVFEDGEILARLKDIGQIAITHAEGGPSTQAWYLGAWLARHIGSQADVRFWSGAGTEAIQSVEMTGPGISLSFSRAAAALHLMTNGVVGSVPFTLDSDFELMREELAILGRDPVYEQVLPRAIAFTPR